MNTNEIVKVLRCGQPIGGWCSGNCEHRENGLCELNPRRVFEQAADLIERLQKELDAAVDEDLIIKAVRKSILINTDETKYRYELGKACLDACCKDVVKYLKEWRGRESEGGT